MNFFETTAVLVTLAAALAYLNARWIKLPTTIGLMALALVLSLIIIGLGHFVPPIERFADHVLSGIEFDETLLNGMLGFLLFAGAMHVDLSSLREQKWVIAVLASIGVLVSTGLVGAMAWLISGLLGIEIPVMYCLAFGALIAPTDPIAVLSLLKRVGAPHSLATKIAGESLFNDGIGVVVFLVIASLIEGFGGHGGEPMGGGEIALLFVQEAGGGAAFGLGIGALAYLMLRSLDDYKTEVLITLALVTGGYALAVSWHLSGPIAMVLAGLLIGNQGRAMAMSRMTREHVDGFWELIDEILNAVLFVLIGLEVLMLDFTGQYLLAGLLAIPAVLLARLVAVGGTVAMLRLRRRFTEHVVKVLTWGGLRGGISVALAFSLRDMTRGGGQPEAVEAILAMTYVVVVFSIIVQGLTVAPLLGRLGLREAPATGEYGPPGAAGETAAR